MSDLISLTDLPQELQSASAVELMLAGDNGQAARVAPCMVGTPSAAQLSEAKLVILGAIIRWTKQGASGVQQQTAGPFGMGIIASQSTGYRLWPTKITKLIAMCSDDETRTIDAIDTVPGGHLDREHLAGCDFFFSGTGGCPCWRVA